LYVSVRGSVSDREDGDASADDVVVDAAAELLGPHAPVDLPLLVPDGLEGSNVDLRHEGLHVREAELDEAALVRRRLARNAVRKRDHRGREAEEDDGRVQVRPERRVDA
jgi:hypothetical protein